MYSKKSKRILDFNTLTKKREGIILGFEQRLLHSKLQ